jgi:hypothetical protein
MKLTNSIFRLGMMALVLLFMAVLAGCATTGGSGTHPTPDERAERLAADLGGVGKAVVEGGTVRLTDTVKLAGVVDLTTSLTVPAGVTLDLTADDAGLILKNGATLTVDGTVDTRGHGDHGDGWVVGGLCIDDGTAVINGSGVIRLRSKGHLLIMGNDNKWHFTLDGVTLVGLEDNDNSLVYVGDGGEFVMKSGAITGNTISGESVSGGGVFVYDGTFTMEGGAITGNTISGESVSGGGVSVYDGTFTMEGGEISGNTLDSGRYANGGGVHIAGGATFTMEGGTISGNTAKAPNGGNGGGIRISGGSIFTMKGGTIYGKSDKLPAGVDASLANSAKSSASLDVYRGTAMWGTGGTYQGGESPSAGGNIVPIDPESHIGTDDTLIATPAP